jgi:hypothetical protein
MLFIHFFIILVLLDKTKISSYKSHISLICISVLSPYPCDGQFQAPPLTRLEMNSTIVRVGRPVIPLARYGKFSAVPITPAMSKCSQSPFGTNSCAGKKS